MIDPTLDEWLEARQRLSTVVHSNAAILHSMVEAALGPCPPEPPPEPFRKDCFMLVETSDGQLRARELALTPDEADAMAAALVEHAHYAREQGATPSRNAPVAGPLIPAPICGRLLVGQGKGHPDPVCQSPMGHAGLCDPHRLAG